MKRVFAMISMVMLTAASRWAETTKDELNGIKAKY